MTHWGTNTYLLGKDAIAIVDPGPVNDSHRQAILDAVAGREVTGVVVTHSHLDHSPLARPLADTLDVPVIAFGASTAGRSAVMQSLAADGLAGGGEGVDHDFAPDVTVADGEPLTVGDVTAKVLHTPGHMGNHIALHWDDQALTGDLVMGWASSLVSPPDGDLTDFLRSCAQLRALGSRAFHSGHGLPIDNPDARIDWLVGHREARTEQIIAALKTGPQSIAELVSDIYRDVPIQMHPAAARNVFAHLVHLHEAGRVKATPHLSPDARFRLI